jgi:acyl carrier protein
VTARESAIADEIRRLARQDLGIEAEVKDGEELAGQLDSLALLSLVVAVEDRFRVRVGEEDAARLRSLADLARFVAARTAEPLAAEGP